MCFCTIVVELLFLFNFVVLFFQICYVYLMIILYINMYRNKKTIIINPPLEQQPTTHKNPLDIKIYKSIF